MVTLEGKLVVRVPAGQQASHARPDSTVALEEPVTLLVIAYQRDSDDIASVSISLLQTAHFYAILLLYYPLLYYTILFFEAPQRGFSHTPNLKIK